MFDLLYGLLLKAVKGRTIEHWLSQEEFKESAREKLTKFTKRVTSVLFFLITALLVIVIIRWAISPNDSPAWTGFGEQVTSTGEVIPAKTLWDWMDLLVVSAVVAAGVFLLNQAARRSERAIDDKKARREKQISADQGRQQALENYLDKMGTLLLDKGLREPEKEEVHVLARARTLATLRSLGSDKASDLEPDGERKAQVLKFLQESGLIERDNVVVDLTGADLAYVNLENADLKKLDLSGCSLMFANLDGADLREVCLDEANIIGATLINSHLENAVMRKAHLSAAKARNCFLTGADLTGAFMGSADLQGANLDRAVLRNVDFRRSNLMGASLCESDLCGADLSEAIVEGTPPEFEKMRVEIMTKAHVRDFELLHINLRMAKFDNSTKWPSTTFDPETYGAVQVE